MGMDVSGINPKNEVGEYFRANCWSWRPIKTLVDVACQRYEQRENKTLLDKKTLSSMNHNDGAGAEDQETCDLLAAEMEAVLADEQMKTELLTDGCLIVDDSEIKWPTSVTPDCLVNANGTFVNTKELLTMTAEQKTKLHSPYSTDREHVAEFIRFLRACGGFEVH